MQKIKDLDLFGLKRVETSARLFWLGTLVVYALAVAIRLIWLYNNYQVPEYRYNGAPIIGSMDGFYYAQGARDILAGDFSRVDSPTQKALPILTAVISKILFFVPFEWIVFLMPAILVPLVVFPISFIGRDLGRPLVGWFAAILTVLTTGYYVRTIVGYYDDDVLTLVLPFWLTWALIKNAKEYTSTSIAILLFTTILYSWWYTNGSVIMLGFAATFASYVVFFDRKNPKLIFGLALMLIAISGFPLYVRILLSAVGAFVFFKYDRFVTLKSSLATLVVSIGLLFASGSLDAFVSKWKFYIFKPNIPATGELKLHYYSSLKTVSESKYSDFAEIAESLSLNEVFLYISVIGVLIAIYRYKALWFLLPTMILGFLAIDGGMRFTPYGAFALSFGLVYLAAIIVQRLPWEWLFAPAMTALMLYPASKYLDKAMHYNPPTSLTKTEVETLAAAKAIVKPTDYIFSWWDWGYPVRYYTHARTHSDGGMQDGPRTFIESQVLTSSSQVQSAHILREAAEVVEKIDSGKLKDIGGTFANIMRYNKLGFVRNPQEMLYMLGANDYPTMEPTRDVYLGLFFRMFQIYSTISAFSQRDLVTGQYLRQNFFIASQIRGVEGEKVLLEQNIVFDKKTGEISDGKQKAAVSALITVELDETGKPKSSVSMANNDGSAVVIDWRPYGMYIVCDNQALSSTFVQMYVFDKYDSRFFEKVIDTPMIKLFRVKR